MFVWPSKHKIIFSATGMGSIIHNRGFGITRSQCIHFAPAKHHSPRCLSSRWSQTPQMLWAPGTSGRADVSGSSGGWHSLWDTADRGGTWVERGQEFRRSASWRIADLKSKMNSLVLLALLASVVAGKAPRLKFVVHGKPPLVLSACFTAPFSVLCWALESWLEGVDRWLDWASWGWCAPSWLICSFKVRVSSLCHVLWAHIKPSSENCVWINLPNRPSLHLSCKLRAPASRPANIVRWSEWKPGKSVRPINSVCFLSIWVHLVLYA